MTIPFHGVWLPLVTPFRDGAVDEASFRRLVARYAGQVDGFIVAATTGEGLALSLEETRRLAEWTAEEQSGTPVLIGLCGASTAGVLAAMRAAETWPADGYLISCPYYVRPSQEGLRLHFEALAGATARGIAIYNIPYRAAVNMGNETMLALAARPNVIGVKDCCADPAQSLDLIARRPEGFNVLTGEDALFLPALRAGAQGGVAATAHLDPEGFAKVRDLAAKGAWEEAEAVWAPLAEIAALLFTEPSPAAVKHCLWRMGVIGSPELRLPMTPVSEGLAKRLDVWLGR